MAFARKSSRRALALALFLHVLGAGLALGARSVLGAELGTVLAAAFLGSMGLRPVHAFYLHTRQRLLAAQRDAAVSSPDALSLAAADTRLDERITELEQELRVQQKTALTQLAAIEARSQEESSAWRRAAASTDEKLERVLREFERTVERTQQGGEVLAGIRAFVQLIRES